MVAGLHTHRSILFLEAMTYAYIGIFDSLLNSASKSGKVIFFLDAWSNLSNLNDKFIKVKYKYVKFTTQLGIFALSKPCDGFVKILIWPIWMTCKSWNINQFSVLSFYWMSRYTCNNITLRRLSYYADLCLHFPVKESILFQIIETVMFGRVIE